VTSASNALLSVWPLLGNESSEVLTQFLPLALPAGQGQEPALAGLGGLGRHGANRIEQVAQRLEPFGGGPRPVDRDLLADTAVENGRIQRHRRMIVAAAGV
jgi:hypothetical protein